MPLKVSESYRGYTVFFDRDTRRWLVAVPPGDQLVAFAAAFQARRAVNLALDGRSESWPKRER